MKSRILSLYVALLLCSCSATELYEDIEYCLNNRAIGSSFDISPNTSEKYPIDYRDKLVRSERFWTYLEAVFERQWKGAPGFKHRKMGFDFYKGVVKQFGLRSAGAMRTVRSDSPEEDRLIILGMAFAMMYVTGMEMGLEEGKNIATKVAKNGGIKFEEIYME